MDDAADGGDGVESEEEIAAATHADADMAMGVIAVELMAAVECIAPAASVVELLGGCGSVAASMRALFRVGSARRTGEEEEDEGGEGEGE